MRARLWAATGLAVIAAGLPTLAAPTPGPQWYAAETHNWLDSTGRVRDQLANPMYAALREQQADTTNADPYRAPEQWAPRRGRAWEVHYRNRYDARISAHIWAPPPEASSPPYPAVVMVN